MKSADLWGYVVNGRENVVDAIPKLNLKEMIVIVILHLKRHRSKLSVHALLFLVAKTRVLLACGILRCQNNTAYFYDYIQAFNINSNHCSPF